MVVFEAKMENHDNNKSDIKPKTKPKNTQIEEEDDEFPF